MLYLKSYLFYLSDKRAFTLLELRLCRLISNSSQETSFVLECDQRKVDWHWRDLVQHAAANGVSLNDRTAMHELLRVLFEEESGCTLVEEVWDQILAEALDHLRFRLACCRNELSNHLGQLELWAQRPGKRAAQGRAA